MGLEIFDRQLRLMLVLTQNHKLTLEQVADELNISKRTLYRYLEEFRGFGFEIVNINGIVRLDKGSAYFRQIAELTNFSEQEAIMLKKILEDIPNKSQSVNQLLLKLAQLYNLELLEDAKGDGSFAENQKLLHLAIKEGWQVKLRDYRSNHSQTISDRLVEPFEFLSNGTEVRCLEIATKTNKSFKITRIGKVEILSTPWKYRNLHTHVYTDAFHFSGEDLIPIRLRLNFLAVSLLKEEFVILPNELVQEDDKHWIYTTYVCSYIGIGRFIMGLLNSIEILQDEGLKQYIQQEIEKYRQKNYN